MHSGCSHEHAHGRGHHHGEQDDGWDADEGNFSDEDVMHVKLLDGMGEDDVATFHEVMRARYRLLVRAPFGATFSDGRPSCAIACNTWG